MYSRNKEYYELQNSMFFSSDKGYFGQKRTVFLSGSPNHMSVKQPMRWALKKQKIENDSMYYMWKGLVLFHETLISESVCVEGLLVTMYNISFCKDKRGGQNI